MAWKKAKIRVSCSEENVNKCFVLWINLDNASVLNLGTVSDVFLGGNFLYGS